MTRRHTERLATPHAARGQVRALACAAACVTLLAAWPAGAQAPVTLTFEGIPVDPAMPINYVANCYVEMGIRISSPGLPCGEDPPATFGLYLPPEVLGYTGSKALFNSLGAEVDFTPVGGGGFAMTSISLAPILLGPLALPIDVTFTGFLLGGGTVTHTVTVPVVPIGGSPVPFALAGFTNLSSVRMTPGAPDFAVQFDDVGAAVVPEPATVTLVALGLVGLAGAARRRRSR